MTTVGILHSGSQKIGQQDIDNIADWLKQKCKHPPVIKVADWSDNLSARAKSLIKMEVGVLLVVGGSRAAHAAIHNRANAKTPVIVFTSVAPHILAEINDPSITTGVCAHTSDHDGARLDYLLEFLQYSYPTIGVLRNSNRGDAPAQWQAINDVQGRCSLVDADVNGHLTIKKAFDLFQQNSVDGVLVAADPFFYNNGREVVDRANGATFPAIYQWSDFVTKMGGLMSYGINRDKCYALAKQMVADIIHGQPVPPVWQPSEADFELVVSKAKATQLNRWPLPTAFANANIV